LVCLLHLAMDIDLVKKGALNQGELIVQHYLDLKIDEMLSIVFLDDEMSLHLVLLLESLLPFLNYVKDA